MIMLLRILCISQCCLGEKRTLHLVEVLSQELLKISQSLSTSGVNILMCNVEDLTISLESYNIMVACLKRDIIRHQLLFLFRQRF